jgi:hypothetical protein
MPVRTYTVYEPRPAPDSIEKRAKSLVFVKDGFSLAAFLLTPIWLLVRSQRILRVSLGLFGDAAELSVGTQSFLVGVYFFVLFIVTPIAIMFNVPAVALICVYLALSVIMGFEARDIYRTNLEARGYVLRAIVTGGSLEECERRYLREWLPDARLDRARLNAELTASGGTDKRNYKEPVIGMFPAHGG